MLTRRVARPLLASWFVAQGLDACRRPTDHVERVREGWHRLAARIDALPAPPSDETLRTAVRAHGAATAVAGLLLVLGKTPRLAACALAALTVPVAALDAPTRSRPAGSHSRPTATTRAEHAFARDLSLIGGAVLAGLDREGSPSLGWRVRHARQAPPGASPDRT